MSSEKPGKHLKLFVGHRPPDFRIWRGFQFCKQSAEIHDYALPSDAVLDQIGDARLSEYHSLFLLKRTLAQFADQRAVITLYQHRRFVLNTPVGAPSVNQSFSRVVSREIAEGLNTDLLFPLGGEFLLGTPFVMTVSVLQQYKLHHPLRDLLRFTAQMIDTNILSEQQSEAFLLSSSFIPVPSCGTFTVDSVIEIMDTLERSFLAFWRGGYLEREGYQKRVCSFLLERLNSFLLIEYLKNRNGDPARHYGYTTTVSENSVIKPG